MSPSKILLDLKFLTQLYDLDGKKYGPIECAQIYVDVLKDFKQSHPDFVGSKFIFAPLRGVGDETFDTYLPILQKLMNNFPDFIAGFDLVGQEDKGSENSINSIALNTIFYICRTTTHRVCREVPQVSE